MIAAPFMGEFGWQCAIWVPYLRYKAHQQPGRDLTVICKTGHYGLYKDFARTIELDPYVEATMMINKVDCIDAWSNGVKLTHDDYLRISEATYGAKIHKRDFLDPTQTPHIWRQGEPPRPSRETKPYRYPPGDKGYDIIIHARQIRDKQPERNWDVEGWDTLQHDGFTFACIGAEDSSECLDGADDLRGIPLSELTGIIAASKVVIGPSSGPLALAMQCATPVVWWSGNEKDVSRFAKHWNPHRSPTERVGTTWKPNVIEVIEAWSKFL